MSLSIYKLYIFPSLYGFHAKYDILSIFVFNQSIWLQINTTVIVLVCIRLYRIFEVILFLKWFEMPKYLFLEKTLRINHHGELNLLKKNHPTFGPLLGLTFILGVKITSKNNSFKGIFYSICIFHSP